MPYELPIDMSDDLEVIEIPEVFRFGCCMCCGDRWTGGTEKHFTRYSFSGGCFPLCEECWQKLETPEKRLPYYAGLLDGWRIQCAYCERKGCDKCMGNADDILAAVRAGK